MTFRVTWGTLVADLLRFKLAYDRAGNRLYRVEDDTSDLDRLCSYDRVNRLDFQGQDRFPATLKRFAV